MRRVILAHLSFGGARTAVARRIPHYNTISTICQEKFFLKIFKIFSQKGLTEQIK
jgi:hypothetical protein